MVGPRARPRLPREVWRRMTLPQLIECVNVFWDLGRRHDEIEDALDEWGHRLAGPRDPPPSARPSPPPSHAMTLPPRRTRPSGGTWRYCPRDEGIVYLTSANESVYPSERRSLRVVRRYEYVPDL